MAYLKGSSSIFIDDEVGVTLTKTCVSIGETRPFIG